MMWVKVVLMDGCCIMLSPIFERFAEASPITVMLRATLERIFSAEQLDELFEATREKQYTQELLFSRFGGNHEFGSVQHSTINRCSTQSI